jgi:hypothetical protein
MARAQKYGRQLTDSSGWPGVATEAGDLVVLGGELGQRLGSEAGELGDHLVSVGEPLPERGNPTRPVSTPTEPATSGKSGSHHARRDTTPIWMECPWPRYGRGADARGIP